MKKMINSMVYLILSKKKKELIRFETMKKRIILLNRMKTEAVNKKLCL